MSLLKLYKLHICTYKLIKLNQTKEKSNLHNHIILLHFNRDNFTCQLKYTLTIS